jgi:hypothetical protein
LKLIEEAIDLAFAVVGRIDQAKSRVGAGERDDVGRDLVLKRAAAMENERAAPVALRDRLDGDSARLRRHFVDGRAGIDDSNAALVARAGGQQQDAQQSRCAKHAQEIHRAEQGKSQPDMSRFAVSMAA